MQKKFCHNCGKEITQFEKFCSNCGQQFVNQSQPSQPIQPQIQRRVKKRSKGINSLLSGIAFSIIIVVAFFLMIGIFTGECSIGDSTANKAPRTTTPKTPKPTLVNSFKNRNGDIITVGSKCFTNGADKNSRPPATLMKLSLYDKSSLNKKIGETKQISKIPHGTKVTILKIESFNGKATAQIKWGNKKGWMSINLLANKYQKPVGDRF